MEKIFGLSKFLCKKAPFFVKIRGRGVKFSIKEKFYKI